MIVLKMIDRKSIRRGLLQIHLYGGLAACWYLLIYGISSLSFNHPWLLPGGTEDKTTWERPVNVSDISDNLKLAEATRDELGLIGWPLPWAMRRDEQNVLHFEHSRPGKKYWIQVNPAEKIARVEEQSAGLKSVVNALHGLSEGIPNSGYMKIWTIYTEFTTWFTLFAIISGIYLWAGRARDKKIALWVFSGSVAVSLGFMGYVYWIG